jgi:hypothetical protein
MEVKMIKHELVFASKSDKMAEACGALAVLTGWSGKIDRCRMCDGVVDSFDDDLSEKEYYISGMCQKCQDEIW